MVACEMAMLASRGHDVELLDFDNEAIIDIAGRTLGALNSFYSTSSRVLVEQRLAAFRPDILHVHNFMPSLSPSVFFAAKTADVPVVQTLHNYRLICANGQLFRDGAPCEDCLRHGSFLPGILHACYRGSRIGSAVIGAGMAAQSLTGTWEHRVDRYIALTAFSASKFAQSRIPGHKVRVKPNFVPDPGIGTGDGGFALFAGRLSAEKGVMTLIAADDLDRLPCPVYIAGEGPLAKVVEAASMRPGSKLVVLGQKTNQQVLELMKKAAVLIFPSLWYEPFGLVMIEALACGLPVIASRIGGLPELVEDQVSGLLYQAGSPQGLCDAVELFLSSQEKMNAMRAAARQRFEQYYSETTNYKLLLDIYEELLQERVLAYPALIHGS